MSILEVASNIFKFRYFPFGILIVYSISLQTPRNRKILIVDIWNTRQYHIDLCNYFDCFSKFPQFHHAFSQYHVLLLHFLKLENDSLNYESYVSHIFLQRFCIEDEIFKCLFNVCHVFVCVLFLVYGVYEFLSNVASTLNLIL